MVTRVFGKIIENIYDVDDKLVQITDENGDTKVVYTGKPTITKETKVKEWSELCSYEGEPRYNKDFDLYESISFGPLNHMLNISEDEEVCVDKEIFRADHNEMHLHTDKVVEELDTNKENAESILNKHVKAFNKMMIESNDQLRAYCDLHKLSYEDTDCIELFKLVFPGKMYVIKNGIMNFYIGNYPNFVAPLSSM